MKSLRAAKSHLTLRFRIWGANSQLSAAISQACKITSLRNRSPAKSHVRLRNRKVAANSQAGIAISQGCELAIDPAITQNNCEFAIDPANSRGLRNRNLAREFAQLRNRSCKCDFAGFHDRDDIYIWVPLRCKRFDDRAERHPSSRTALVRPEATGQLADGSRATVP